MSCLSSFNKFPKRLIKNAGVLYNFFNQNESLPLLFIDFLFYGNLVLYDWLMAERMQTHCSIVTLMVGNVY